MGKERLTIQDAARRLGVSESAIRKRVSRGTLSHEKGADRRTYVYIDAPSDTVSDNVSDDVSDAVSNTSTSALTSELRNRIDSLEDQVAYLRGQLDDERQARTEERRRADTVIAQLTSRIPQLEAPQEPQNAPESAEPQSDRETPEEPSEAQRPFWRRWFGG